MPYDKETVDRAKKLGVFERSIDAEALKTDERERQKLAEKLRKYTSTTQSPAISAQGEMELVELPLRREEVIEVELSLWDRIIMLIMSLLGLMSSPEYKKSKALKRLEQKLRRQKPTMIDPSRGYLSGEFGRVIISLYEQAKLLRSIFDVFLNNEDFWKGIGVEKSSCEYLFEKITDLENVVESYKDFESHLSKIVEVSQSVKIAVKAVDEEINSMIRLIPDELIKRADNIFNNIVKLREFAYFDFETIVRRFTQFSEIKRGRVVFKSVSPQGLINHIRDIESILLSLNVDDIYTAQYIKAMLEYIEKYSSSGIEKLEEIKNKLDSNFFSALNENIRKLSIVDLVAYVTKDPSHKPFIIKTNYSLFKEFSKILSEKYRRIVMLRMEEKNNKLIDKYITMMFDKNPELSEYGIYSSSVSALFSRYGLPPLLYTKPLAISSYFIKNVWDTSLKDTITTLVVSGVFSEKQLQKTLYDLISKVEPVKSKMNDFVKAVEQGGEYYILLSRFISNPSLLTNESNKKVVERKITIMNSLCFEFLNAFKDIFKGMYKILSYIVEDVYAPFPRTVVNIHKIGGVSSKDFIDRLEKSVEKLNALSSLITLFVEE
ncbi:MAG: DUF5312 family protein [Brevinematia bacterium]